MCCVAGESEMENPAQSVCADSIIYHTAEIFKQTMVDSDSFSFFLSFHSSLITIVADRVSILVCISQNLYDLSIIILSLLASMLDSFWHNSLPNKSVLFTARTVIRTLARAHRHIFREEKKS